MSLRFPPVRLTASGTPEASVRRWCLEPGRPRSTGLGPVFELPFLPAPGWSPRSPVKSRSHRRRAAWPKAADEGAPTPRPPATPQADASKSPPSPSQAQPTDRARGSRCAAHRGSPTDSPDQGAGSGPGSESGARAGPTAAAQQAPKARRTRSTVCVTRASPPMMTANADSFAAREENLLFETSSKTEFPAAQDHEASNRVKRRRALSFPPVALTLRSSTSGAVARKIANWTGNSHRARRPDGRASARRSPATPPYLCKVADECLAGDETRHARSPPPPGRLRHGPRSSGVFHRARIRALQSLPGPSATHRRTPRPQAFRPRAAPR